ncbi:succinylglutamate-semialdehyde dehydrogenase [Escherichia coli]
MTLWINGDWITGQGASRVKRNPVSGEVLWQGNDADAAQVEQACRAARAAFPRWARLSLAERQVVVERFAGLLERNKGELTAIIARETGKPRWEAATEVTAMINKIAISIKAYHVRTGEQRSEMPDGAASLRHRPHGVLAVFGPYNFPGHLPNGHIVPALLAGNTIIFKPSELTPWSGEAVMRLWQQAGLPPGVLNLVQGGRETGQALSALEDLDGLLFTGSANTGYQLHRQLSGQPEKILALEMGGNNPLIIDEVADIDAAVHLTIQSAFVTAGQRCTCARRLLLKSGAQGDAFLARLVAVSQRLTPGNWDDEPQPFIGGLISEQAAQQVVTAWQQLEAMGGRTLLAPRLLQSETSLLTPGIIEMTGVAGVPDVIDQGVFHNDVIAVSNRQVLFCHQQAFARQSQLLANLRARVNGFMAIEVPATQVSVSDAVSTYLFNSQLLSRDDGSMMLVLPQECREHAGVWGYLNELLAADNPISELKVFDLRESMANGGGPACLRLRVVLTEEERRAVNPAVMMNDTLFNALNDWVDRYYRDRLTAADLADPQLLRGGREALDVLSQLLNLGSVYPFQREGGGNG